jgi:DNA-3-methyladenine glycosylase I
VPHTLSELPSSTADSKALARELKRRGFRFVGPTTAYALMQATGIVNDHVAGCFVRDAVEAERVVAARSAAASPAAGRRAATRSAS